jgi:DNA transformation protein
VSVSESYHQYVLEQLSRVPGVSSRRMFGGVALYTGRAIFAILDNEQVFFRVDDSTRPEFKARGASPWDPMPGREKPSQGYYELPAEILDDRDVLTEWAGRAAQIAEARLKEKGKTGKKKKTVRRKTIQGKKTVKLKAAKKKAAKKKAVKKRK